MQNSFRKLAVEAKTRHVANLKKLDARIQALRHYHRKERANLAKLQQERWGQEARARNQRYRKGLKGIFDKLSGKHREIRNYNEREFNKALLRDRDQKLGLISQQQAEMKLLYNEQRILVGDLGGSTEEIEQLKKTMSKFSNNSRPDTPSEKTLQKNRKIEFG